MYIARIESIEDGISVEQDLLPLLFNITGVDLLSWNKLQIADRKVYYDVKFFILLNGGILLQEFPVLDSKVVEQIVDGEYDY